MHLGLYCFPQEGCCSPWAGLQLISLIAVLILSCAAAQAQQLADNPQVTIHTNHGAIRLYANLGFEQAGKKKRYYRDNDEDACIMLLEQLTGEERPT